MTNSLAHTRSLPSVSSVQVAPASEDRYEFVPMLTKTTSGRRGCTATVTTVAARAPAIGAHVRPPSRLRNEPCSYVAAYTMRGRDGAYAISRTFVSGARPSLDRCHVRPPSLLR